MHKGIKHCFVCNFGKNVIKNRVYAFFGDKVLNFMHALVMQQEAYFALKKAKNLVIHQFTHTATKSAAPIRFLKRTKLKSIPDHHLLGRGIRSFTLPSNGDV